SAIRDLLSDNHPVLLGKTVQAVSALKISGVESALRRIARDSTQASDLRVSALRELIRRQPKLEDVDFDFLEGQLARNHPPNVRLAAAETLLAANLSASQLVPFLNSIRSENLISPVSVLTSVERQNVGAVTLPLLDYLSASLDAGWTLPADRIIA